jgi:hypothetical protein
MSKLCRLAIPIALLCFAWPAAANAEISDSGLSFGGSGGTQSSGGSASGTVFANDVVAADITDNTLTWDRAWSTTLIDNPAAMWGRSKNERGWCQSSGGKGERFDFTDHGSDPTGRSLQPYLDAITGLMNWRAEIVKVGDYSVKPQLSFKTSGPGSNVIGSLTSGSCSSPMAYWDYQSGAFESANGLGYGMTRGGAQVITAIGNHKLDAAEWSRAVRDNKTSLGANKYSSWAWGVLRGRRNGTGLASQIGWRNKGPVHTDLKSNPNGSGIRKPKFFTNLTGLDSDSELLPLGPNLPTQQAVAKSGNPVEAVVRVWRECDHKYPDPNSGNTTPLPVYTNSKQECTTQPLYERTIPVVNKSGKDQSSEHAPYKGDTSHISSVGVNGKYNYWNVARDGGKYSSTTSSSNNSRNALDGIKSAGDNATVAGALFTSCAGAPTSNKWCEGPVKPGSNTGTVGVGRLKSGAPAEPSVYQDYCTNGGQAADKAWKYPDYLAQIAYLYAAGRSLPTAASASGAHTSKAGKLTPEQFVKLFIGWNPVLEKYGLSGSGTVLDTKWNSAEQQPAGWPQGLSLESATAGRREACRIMNEWIAVDWNMQGKNKGQSKVDVQLNMKPNHLYAVQIVMLDSRENIVAESLQMLAAPASGQMPSITKTWSCPAGLGDATLTENPEGLTEDQLKTKCGSPPEPTCHAFDSSDSNLYPVGDPLCSEDINTITPAYPPATGSWDQYQPISQMIGQSCLLPCRQPAGVEEPERYGNVRIAPSGGSTDQPPAGGTEGTPPARDTGLWIPRHLKVSILNPDNNRKTTGSADDPHGYRSSHRIQVQNDPDPDSSMRRFKNSNQYVLDNNENDFSPAPGFWQAQLPLDAPAVGSPINLMGSAYSVAVSNPTRTPDTDQVEAATQAPDPVLAASQLQSKVDETRISTLLGEGHYPALTTTSSSRTNNQNGTTTTDNTRIREETHRLTADSCPNGQIVPLVQNATDPARTTQACNPSFNLGSGWTVADAYKLPIQSPGEIMELDASFANLNSVTGAEQDAYINLDSSDTSIKDRIATTQAPESADKTSGGIELWDRHAFLTRDASSHPAYRLALNASNSTNLIFCKPIAPHYVQIKQYYTASVIKPAGTQAHHLSSDTIRGMESNPGSLESDSVTRPSATPEGSGAAGTWVPYDERGSAGTVPSDLPGKRDVPAGSYARQHTSWPLAHYDSSRNADRESSLSAKGWNSAWERNAPSWNRVKGEFDGGSYKTSTQGNSIFWQQGGGEPHPGQWLKNKYQHNCAAADLAGSCGAGSSNYNNLGSNWGRNPWNTFGEGGSIWGGGIDGKDWWFGPDDQQDTQIWEAGTERRYRMVTVLAGDVGRCEKNPGTDASPNYPNANLINPDTGNLETDPATGQPVKAATLPAGDWVVRYQLTNGGSQSLPAVERWGISATYTGNESVVWVSRFDVTQHQNRTAIYRIRPSG